MSAKKHDTSKRGRGSTKPRQPAIEREMYKNYYGGRRPASLSSTIREAEAIEDLLWSEDTPQDVRDKLTDALLDLATLTGVNIAHHRLAKLAYKEMMYAFSHFGTLTVRNEKDEDVKRRHTAIMAQIVKVCDIFDPEREWSYGSCFAHFHGKDVLRDKPANATGDAACAESSGRRVTIQLPAGVTSEDLTEERLQVIEHDAAYLEHLGIKRGDLLVMYNASDETQGDLVAVCKEGNLYLGFLNVGSTFEVDIDPEPSRVAHVGASSGDDDEDGGWTFKPHEFQFAGRVVEVLRAGVPVKPNCALRPLHEVAEQEGAR